MWGMMFASGLQLAASANADKAAGVAPEEASQGIPNMEGELPTPEQLLEMLDSLAGISDEEKATLKEELLKNLQDMTGAGMSPAGNDMTMQTMVLLSLLALVALIFVFFVYKLFKCLSERQIKREEKKKIKQMKKKK
ncbi:uncharacterized protein LOC114879543 isoform X1 [Osmia bicornis bicornis]|uniref:uncharacterized protein LOC114879543 isoform X1 n=1 Tax=Osmia bicornis bicornis TaxID=1437191 RepID=UPI0010F9C9B4|nr:uncharacterized protein LOC114879543 isoform X1 [Osmia bicornis bicornis]